MGICTTERSYRIASVIITMTANIIEHPPTLSIPALDGFVDCVWSDEEVEDADEEVAVDDDTLPFPLF